MAGTFTISEVGGGNSITLSPLSAMGPVLNKDLGEITLKTMDGGFYIYQKSNKVDHQFMVNNVSKHDADHINAWKIAGTTLTYTDPASASYSVLIANSEIPLKWMANTAPDSLFEGTIILREL